MRGLDLQTGLSQTLPLTDLGGGRRHIAVTIAAGDLLVFKMQTGRDFARGPG